MRIQTLIATLFLALAVGCASSDSRSMASSGGMEPQLTLVPEGISSDILYFRGPIALSYGLQVTNPTSTPLTLRRLNLQTIGPGAYALSSGNQPMNRIVQPNGTTTLKVSTWGRARGGFLASAEPVTVRIVAQFEDPMHHTFQKLYTQNIDPTGGLR